jgi:hypothetical protein
VHTPATHIRLPTHFFPHPPQLARSVSVSTHAPEQADNPALHWTPHFCMTQVATPFAGTLHAVLHPPQ